MRNAGIEKTFTWKAAGLLVVAIVFAGAGLVFSHLSPVAADAPKPAASRRYINLPSHSPQLPFSDAVKLGNTLYISGRLGLDPKTQQAPADLDQEIRYILEDYQRVLAEGGMTMDDLVYVQVYCTDLSLFDKWNQAYRQRFHREFPSRAFLGAASLLRGAHFEMQAIAVKE